jgi:hypothetical protein
MTVRYELEHSKDSVTWFFGRQLSPDESVARSELARMRDLAAGNQTGVRYRVVKTTTEVTGW